MPAKIFPKEVIELTREFHLLTITKRTQFIYIVFVVSILAVISGLPFVYIDVGVSSNGILVPIMERNEIFSPNSGVIDEFLIHENKKVQKGDFLFSLNNKALNEALKDKKRRKLELENFIYDLNLLTSGNNISNSSLKSDLCKSQLAHFSTEIARFNLRINKFKADLKRNRLLFNMHIGKVATFRSRV